MSTNIISSDSLAISQMRNQIASMEMELSLLKAKSIEAEINCNMWRETAEDLAAAISDVILSVHGREAGAAIEKLANRARIRNSYGKTTKKKELKSTTGDNVAQECVASETGIGVREIQFDQTE
jgi:hypothetical protein